MAKEKKMTTKEWLKEYAPDMGYKFVDKSKGGKHYSLVNRVGKATVFETLDEAQRFLLRALHKYIGEHTTIVDARGNVLEMSEADKRKQKR